MDKIKAFFAPRRPLTLEERLSRRMYVGVAIISFVSFSFIFEYKFGFQEHMLQHGVEGHAVQQLWAIATNQEALTSLIPFLVDQWYLKVTFLAIFLWMFRYRRAVENELPIMADLFSRIMPPHEWEAVVGRQSIALLSVGITAAFLAMAFFVDNLPILAMVFLMLNLFDLHGNRLIRMNLYKFLRDRKYKPKAGRPETPFMIERRKVAARYWLEKPQVERIILMALAAILAFVLQFSDEIVGMPVPAIVPYGVLVAAVIGNEITMHRWRVERDADLRRIRDEEIGFRQRDATEA